jgi:hypothetical protein
MLLIFRSEKTIADGSNGDPSERGFGTTFTLCTSKSLDCSGIGAANSCAVLSSFPAIVSSDSLYLSFDTPASGAQADIQTVH